MTTSQLAELFLLRVYEVAEIEGHEERVELNEVAAEFGVTDVMKINNVGRLLHNRGLIKAIFSTGDGAVRTTITGEGALFVERGGDTGVIRSYREDPRQYLSIDQSTHFHGAISGGNIAIHSAETKQSTAPYPQVETLLTELAAALQADLNISKERRQEYIADVAII